MNAVEPSRCRLCQESGQLSEDHVPPRCVTGGKEVVRHNFIKSPNEKGKYLQSGLKFKTICPRCNSKLGSDYDPELCKLTAFVKYSNGAQFETDIRLKVRPARLARAVVGHLISGTWQNAKLDEEQDTLSEFDKDMSPYFHKKSAFPSDYRMYYFVYPHERTVILRDCFLCYTDGRPEVLCQIIKFHPLGFIVTRGGKIDKAIDITGCISCGMDDEVGLLMGPRIDDQEWPESPCNMEGRFLFGGAELKKGTVARPRKR